MGNRNDHRKANSRKGMEKISKERREALLLKKEHNNEGCPGCIVEKRKNTIEGVPWNTLISIWIIVLCNALPISSLFLFLYFTIRDFNIAEEEADVSYYAGFVGCSYMVGRALTSVLWGVVADRFGRKPVLIIGTFTVVIFNTLFGLSINFWMAISTRFLLGSSNGSIGLAKAYISEVCREEHQAIGMSVITTAWGIGLVIGPALGGLLAQPAQRYPHIFKSDSLFGRFPYFLPCLVISTLAVIVTIGTFWLPESLHNHKLEKSSSDSYKIEEGATSMESSSVSKESLLRNRPLMSAIVVYCIFSLQETAYTEIFSLWAVGPQKLGGLSYSSKEVGSVLAITGVGMFICQLSLYSYADKTLVQSWWPEYAGYPFIALLSGLSLSVLLNCASIIRSLLSVCMITSTFVLQNRAVDQDQRGAANGISMTTMSLFKAVGPACGGALLSWSEKSQDDTFPGTHMLFFVLNVMQLIGVVWTFKPLLVERT